MHVVAALDAIVCICCFVGKLRRNLFGVASTTAALTATMTLNGRPIAWRKANVFNSQNRSHCNAAKADHPFFMHMILQSKWAGMNSVDITKSCSDFTRNDRFMLSLQSKNSVDSKD